MKVSKSPEELFRQRTKRVEDAIQLKVPDRVPHIPYFSYFPAKYAGITPRDAFYDYNKWKSACIKTILDFEPDMYFVAPIIPGPVLEALDCKQVKWPGHGVSPEHTHQYRDEEYMKATEYDDFLKDPSDYAVRTYMPRIYGALDILRKLPPLRQMLLGYTESKLTEILVAPECIQAFESLFKAGREMQKWNAAMTSFTDETAKLGFPSFVEARAQAPFDLLPDFLRGMRGAMLDMYKQPDKLLEACEKILPMMIETGVAVARQTGNPRVFIPLHWGSEGFMSLKQFETFYFPTFKRLVQALVDRGLTPCPFFEGDYTSRLEYLLELPRGKVLGHFDTTDIFKAKKVLGNHMCIRGNVPVSLLQTGTPQQVRDYCKKLIDIVGKDGGFIMASRGPMDEAKPENVKAMFDFTREYGVYR